MWLDIFEAGRQGLDITWVKLLAPHPSLPILSGREIGRVVVGWK